MRKLSRNWGSIKKVLTVRTILREDRRQQIVANSTNEIFTVSVTELAAAIQEMSAGDRILLSGDIYTARDAAHKKIFALIEQGGELPFDIRGAVIYYAGPTPGGARPIGSCGPTTSGRMDAFSPKLYDMGLAATVGKGERSQDVCDAIVKNKAAYLCAIGGAGALISKHISAAREIAFPELGCESIKQLTVTMMPLIVGIDCRGGDLFKTGRESYARNIM